MLVSTSLTSLPRLLHSSIVLLPRLPLTRSPSYILHGLPSTSSGEYLVYTNKLSFLIRHSEKKYYEDRVQDLQENIRYTWRLINKIIHEQRDILDHLIAPSISVEGSLLNDPVKVAIKFNKFFVNIGSY